MSDYVYDSIPGAEGELTVLQDDENGHRVVRDAAGRTFSQYAMPEPSHPKRKKAEPEPEPEPVTHPKRGHKAD